MRNSKRAIAFLGAVIGATTAANAQVNPPLGFFDWDTNTSPGTNFQVSPFISDNPTVLAEAKAALNAAVAKGRPLAVKVNTPLTTAAAKNIFRDYAIQYVFADFEGSDSITQTKAISTLVLNSAKSQGAFVGNFHVYPQSGSDPTRRASPSGTAASFSPENVTANGQYTAILATKPGANSNRMANEALYPGAPDFRNPVTGDSTAPNVRSALFTLPIIRAGYTTEKFADVGTPQNKHIPWVSRFNNWGNSSLDSDGNSANGFQYVQNAANPANGQLPSRGDFQAQILHYRMRGADSVNLFEATVSSVVGYSRQSARDDVITGWGASNTANGIFTRKNFAFANLGSVIGVSGNVSAGTGSSEATGAIWSGVYDKSGTGRKLSILISNLSNSNYNVDLPNSIGGFQTVGGDNGSGDDYQVAAGSHRLLAFTLSGGFWQLDSSSFMGLDNNRNGVGIPEPTTLSLLGIGAAGLLIRRRRQA